MIKITSDQILIMVDDDEMELRLFERFVAKSDLSNKVLTFDSGERFLEYLAQVEKDVQPMPGLVLMDVRMPVLDGFDVVSEVRKSPKFRKMPIIMMFSNSNEESDIRRANEVGADGYQVKPSGGEDYIAFLNSLM